MALTQRVRRVSNQKELDAIVDDFVTSGYSVVARSETNARVVKKAKKDKHLLIFLVFGWWTFGIANLIYALVPAKIEDEVTIKISE